jgi:hypothetical protein
LVDGNGDYHASRSNIRTKIPKNVSIFNSRMLRFWFKNRLSGGENALLENSIDRCVVRQIAAAKLPAAE